MVNNIENLSYKFALNSIELYKAMEKRHLYSFSNQFIRSATSIGANVREAQYAQSKKDFLSKLQIALKEANENLYWLQLLKDSKLIEYNDIDKLIEENLVIIRILTSIVKTTKANIK